MLRPFGSELLRDWMDRRGVTLNQMAELLSIDFTFVSKLANGTRRPSLKLAVEIENVTGISIRSWAIATDQLAKRAS